MHVATYVRISEDPLHIRAGVERQLADTRAIAAARWPDVPVTVYEDNDLSAYKKVRRPAYEQLRADIQAGRVRAVVGYNLDRMFRRPAELESFIELCETAHLHDVVTAEGDLDLTTDGGQLHARILTAVAMKSSRDTSRRTKRAMATAREAGRWPGVTPQFAARPDVAEWCCRQIIAGKSMRWVARELPAAYPDGPRFKGPIGLKKALSSPRLADMLDAQHATLVTNTQTILRDPARSRASRGRVYWLTGIIRCGRAECGASLVRFTNTRGYAVWECRACLGVSISAAVDDVVYAMLKRRAETIIAPDRAVASDGEREALESRLGIIYADYAEGTVTRAEWLSAKAAIDRKLTAIRTTLTATRVPLTALWPTMGPADRHDVAARFLIAVHVAPATVRGARLDWSRVRPEWVQTGHGVDYRPSELA